MPKLTKSKTTKKTTTAKSKNMAVEDVIYADGSDTTMTGKTTLIRAESGVSFERKGVWYKLAFTEERMVDENCNIEYCRQHLWNVVNSEVDRQVENILESDK